MYQANRVATHADPPRIEKFVRDPVLARHEARWLAEAVHPGVVRLLSWSPDRCTIDTELVAGPTLRTAAFGPDDAAAALSSLARTIADLHERGFVHANLSPDHLLVDWATPGGVPLLVLCSPKGRSPSDRLREEGRFGVRPEVRQVDWIGFQRCVDWLIDEWRRRSVDVPTGWNDLLDNPASFRRVAYRLDQLIRPKRRRRGR